MQKIYRYFQNWDIGIFFACLTTKWQKSDSDNRAESRVDLSNIVDEKSLRDTNMFWRRAIRILSHKARPIIFFFARRTMDNCVNKYECIRATINTSA